MRSSTPAPRWRSSKPRVPYWPPSNCARMKSRSRPWASTWWSWPTARWKLPRPWPRPRLYEDQRKALSTQREGARLDSRTLEANQAQQQNARLQQQLDEMNAKQTERGLVMTLGDLLFATGRSELRAGTVNNLDKLALFLKQHQDRDVLIEGHTDNVGSEEANLSLSQRRADSVMNFLRQQGVASIRLGSSGKGESTPVASNDSASGRQMNRRVEVIIRNTSSTQN